MVNDLDTFVEELTDSRLFTPPTSEQIRDWQVCFKDALCPLNERPVNPANQKFYCFSEPKQCPLYGRHMLNEEM